MTSKGEIRDLRENVALSHRLLYRTGLATTRGHTSARVPGQPDQFLIKPWPHIQMHRMTASDMIIMDIEGTIVEGPSGMVTRVSEWPIHAEIYKAQSSVDSIIHTHQPWASMMAIAGKTILPVLATDAAAALAEPAPVMSEDRALIRRVAQGQAVAALLGSAPACHLLNHGMVFAGPDVETVTVEAIDIEYQAELNWRASLISGSQLPTTEMASMLERSEKAKAAWENYWRWADANPESLYPRTYDI